MFVVTISCNRRKLLGLAGAAVLICGLLTGAYVKAEAGAMTVVAELSPTGVNTNEERVAYLGQYGWAVEEEPLVVEEVLIPQEMDESYQSYVTLQAEQGFDLTSYSGERVKRYTYQVTNYPTGEEGVQVSLLIHGSQVVGGEVYSTQIDGFLHGFVMIE